MKLTQSFTIRPLLILFCLAALITAASMEARAQEQQRPAAQTDDVVRINTDLVQTTVTVLDKKGHLVEGLQREQFELRVDGKPEPISFFERVTAGSAREEQLGARDGSNRVAATTQRGSSTYRGRTIIFFIDDLHLSLQSVGRTRQMLQHFIESEMGPRDVVIIASASGQIGFLQQFTDNREVLRAAASRLNARPFGVHGFEASGTQMSEYMALTIDSGTDSNVTNVFIEECMKQSSFPKRDKRSTDALRFACEIRVKNSARSILMQASAITRDMYASLESLIRSSARLPGRKLAFFVSDGFLLDTGARSGGLIDKLQQVTDAASRSGVVIYTIDARGLISGTLDATNNILPDANGRMEQAALREIPATQDALHALAGDTGGRALRNQNDFNDWVSKALDETSNYYLLAWRPETEEQKGRKFRRVEVSITGRPDLTVRLPRGYVEGAKVALPPATAAAGGPASPQPNGAAKTPDTDFRDALTDFYTRGSLPTLLSLNYLNTPGNGTVLTSSMQIESTALTYGADGHQPASVDIAGLVLNDKGKTMASFKNRLNVNPLSTEPVRASENGVIYNHRATLEPGIYQVRVAARDVQSGSVGSAMQWVVIPDLARRKLTMSSLLLGGQVLETANSKASTAQPEPQVQFSVDHRFLRSSHLNFWVFIYNATRDAGGTGAANLTAQVQILRDGQPIVTTPQRKLTTQGMTDLARIPYGGDIPLKSLAAGRYELRVTITDLTANTTVSQSAVFEVD